MTRLAIMSDLHIDINRFEAFEYQTLINVLQDQNIEHLHLAGDISNHHYTTSLPFIERLSKQLTVTFHLGNHDMLDLSEETIQALDFQCYPINKQKQLLVFHGWYDYSFRPQQTEREHQKIKKFWFDRRLNRPHSDPKLTKIICERLDTVLSKMDEPPIVIMHFVPHSDFVMTHPHFQPFNAFLGSQCFHDIFKTHKIQDVVFEHSHRSFGTNTIDGVTYHSRPLG